MSCVESQLGGLFMKKTGKRVLSVFLSVLMCLTVFMMDWSGLMPTANAAATYEWRVRVNSSNNTGGWDTYNGTVYGKTNYGTGTESSMKILNIKRNQKKCKKKDMKCMKIQEKKI